MKAREEGAPMVPSALTPHPYTSPVQYLACWIAVTVLAEELSQSKLNQQRGHLSATGGSGLEPRLGGGDIAIEDSGTIGEV